MLQKNCMPRTFHGWRFWFHLYKERLCSCIVLIFPMQYASHIVRLGRNLFLNFIGQKCINKETRPINVENHFADISNTAVLHLWTQDSTLSAPLQLDYRRAPFTSLIHKLIHLWFSTFLSSCAQRNQRTSSLLGLEKSMFGHVYRLGKDNVTQTMLALYTTRMWCPNCYIQWP